ncbi:MAG: NADH:flavin oxidoreductase/NADH oxidase [Hyphomicrobiaceae bacterium]
MPSKLFSPLALRSVELPNRIVVAPMAQYAGRDGHMTDWHVMHLGSLALGGPGLLFSEVVYTHLEGRISKHCLALCSDETEASFKRVVGFCKAEFPTPLAIQIGHAGRKGCTRQPWEGRRPYTAADGGWTIVAPSALPYDPGSPMPEALDTDGMERIKRQFAETARRAARVGFDVAEVHMAHGYLLNSFLSPLTNRRNDGYGGEIENRMRFPLEVLAAVREAFPADRPVGVRISATDWVTGGWDIADSVRFAQILEDVGCDFLDVSSGGISPDQKLTVAPGYQVRLAAEIKRHLRAMPVIAVGLVRDPQDAERIVRDGEADLVAIARGALYEPHWPWRAADELGVVLDYPHRYERARPDRWPEAFGRTRPPRGER